MELRLTKWIEPRLSTGMKGTVRLLGRGNLYDKSVHDYNVRLGGTDRFRIRSNKRVVKAQEEPTILKY